MEIRKGYIKVYPLPEHRMRYHVGIYKPSFLDILAANCVKDIEEAKKRTSLEKGYRYFPSNEYKDFVKKYKTN